MCDRYSCILPDSSRLHRKRWKVIKIVAFSTLTFVEQQRLLAKSNDKGVISANNVDVITDKMLIPGRNVLQRNVMQTQTFARLEEIQVKNMFKQHVNSMIWTWFSLFEHCFWSIWLWLQTAIWLGIYARIHSSQSFTDSDISSHL